MKIYDPKDNVFNAVDAVVNFGFAAIEGTKIPAITYSEQVIKCLEAYKDILPLQNFQKVPNRGYLYYVYDGSRFSSGDEKLKELVLKVAMKNPIN